MKVNIVNNNKMSAHPHQIYNFVIDNSDKNVYDIVSKLLFLSKIKVGEKINTYDFCLEENNWWTTIKRTIFRDQSREKSLEFIRSLIDSALETATKCFESPEEFHKNIGMFIVVNLDNSHTGINYLTETYNDDRMYVSKLETLLGILKEKTEVLKKRYTIA